LKTLAVLAVAAGFGGFAAPAIREGLDTPARAAPAAPAAAAVPAIASLPPVVDGTPLPSLAPMHSTVCTLTPLSRASSRFHAREKRDAPCIFAGLRVFP